MDTHASAGFDRRLDYLTCLVQDVARRVENVTAGTIRSILPDDQRPKRLITGGCAFLSRHFDDRSRNRYWFRGCLFVFRRTRLRKCQWRNQRAGESNNCSFHNASFLMSKLPELLCLEQEPLRAFATVQFYLGGGSAILRSPRLSGKV